ncbi:MAG: PKD domain-containing protein [Planctomycetota bacterium]|nr:PKD domain-containing protein [Planctomycetota bacterium]
MDGESLIVNGTGSFDSDGSVLSYHWDFGDGTALDLPAPGGAVPPPHIYPGPGVYMVSLVVLDDHATPSAPVLLEVHIPGGADDLDLYVSTASFAVNDKLANRDTFTLKGLLNRALLPVGLNGLNVELSLNDVPVGPVAVLDGNGRFATARGVVPSFLASISAKTGALSLTLRSAALRAILDPPPGDLRNAPFPVEVKVVLSGGGLGADVTLLNRLEFSLTQRGGISPKGTYRFSGNRAFGGVFMVSRYSVTENPALRGGGHKVTLSGLILPAGGVNLEPVDAPTVGDLRVTLGDEPAIDVPFGALNISGATLAKTTFTLNARAAGAPPELPRLMLRNSNRTFSLATGALHGTGVPLAGTGSPLTHDFPVVLEIETPAGPLRFDSTLRLTRTKDTLTSWR